MDAKLLSMPSLTLEQAPHIAQWRAMKFGLMMHWGLYSVAGGVWRGKNIEDYNEQIMHRAKIAWPDYMTLTEQFTASAWDPDSIAQVAAEAGMSYVVITTKHHDGFNLWHTQLSDFNAAQATPAGRDLLKPLAQACEDHELQLGFYYSLIDWHYPGALPMSDTNSDPLTPALEEYSLGQLRELLTGYGPLCEIWFDMGAPTAEQSRKLAAVVRELQPDCLSSGRIWNGYDDFMECSDNETPEYWFDGPWESSVTMFHETWGYRSWQQRDSVDEKVREKVRDLAFVTARGGNYLLNIGPRGDGSLVEWEVDVLRGIGNWMQTHGEAIYEGEPQPHLELDFGYATARPGRLYLHVTQAASTLNVPGWRGALPRAQTLAGTALTCRVEDGILRIELPEAALDPYLTIIALDYDDAQPYVPKRTIELKTDTVELPLPASLPWHRMIGEDYYSLRRFVAGREWLVRASSEGVWELTTHRANGGMARGYRLLVDGVEKLVVLAQSKESQTVAFGTIHLSGDTIYSLILRPLESGGELHEEGVSLHLRRA